MKAGDILIFIHCFHVYSMDKSTSKIFQVYKPVGITPAQLIDIFREKFPEYKKISISHAGKLDPLAEGLMILLTGNLTKQKNFKKYLNLDKEYQAKILFGFSTDSYDIQGIPKKGNNQEIDIEKLKQELKKLNGIYEQEIPVFSGRKVNGKPLYYYARNNKLNQIKIPKEEVEIKITFNNIEKISSQNFLKEIIRKINLLNGDFRQEEIKNKWKEFLNKENKEYLILNLTIKCSSGTYIRSIANDLGKKFNSAILFDLIRTKIDNFKLEDSIRL